MNRTLTAMIAGLALGGALLTGCGGDDEGEADDPGTTESSSVGTSESAPTDETSTEATEPSEPVGTDDTDSTDPDETDDPDETEPTEAPDTDDTDGTDGTDGPTNPEAAEFCLAFETAFEAIEDLGEEFSGEPGDQVPPAVIDALRTWGDDLADADLPSDLSPDARAGVDVQVKLLQSIPDRLTFGELDALEADLSAKETKQSTATTEYASANCDLF